MLMVMLALSAMGALGRGTDKPLEKIMGRRTENEFDRMMAERDARIEAANDPEKQRLRKFRAKFF